MHCAIFMKIMSALYYCYARMLYALQEASASCESVPIFKSITFVLPVPDFIFVLDEKIFLRKHSSSRILNGFTSFMQGAL